MSILGIGSLSGNYNQEQAEALATMLCSSSSSATAASQNLTVVQDRINPDAVSAWKECVALNAAGLKTRTAYRETDQQQMTVEMWYVAPIGAPPQTGISNVIINPANSMKCAGTLTDAWQAKAQIATNSVAMSCERTTAGKPFELNGRQVLAAPSSVTVMTRSGTFTRHFAPIYATPPSTPMLVPVGTIIAFHGSMAEAEGHATAGWLPCDNRVINDPLSPLNGQRTPNLVSRFLIGGTASGTETGAASFTIPAHTVESRTYGFQGPAINQDPRVTVWSSLSWVTGTPIASRGTTPEVTVPLIPPATSVIYLIKVK